MVGPATRAAVLQMARLWAKIDVLSGLAGLVSKPAGLRKSSAALFVMISVPVLAVLFFGLFFGLFVGLWGGGTLSLKKTSAWMTISDRTVYETAVGEHSIVSFSDGTQVRLNSNTLIRVKYTDYKRLFALERGEIHIEVAHDEARPLTVSSAGIVIQAVGTAFNVEINSDQNIELLVTDGKVLVGVDQSIQPQSIFLADSGNSESQTRSSVLVSKGEKITLGSTFDDANDGVGAVEKNAAEDIEVKLSWRQGNLIFRGESLGEATTEISRYTSVEFIFLDDNLKKLRIAGLFKIGDVNGFLRSLRDNFNISYQRVGERKIILSRE